MLRFNVVNERERQQLEHAAGPIEFGRGPKRNTVPRCQIQDAYVSKDHVLIEELANGEVRIENLSQKQPIVLPDTNIIAPGTRRQLTRPIRLGVGDSYIDVEPALPEGLHRDALETILQPLRGGLAINSEMC